MSKEYELKEYLDGPSLDYLRDNDFAELDNQKLRKAIISAKRMANMAGDLVKDAKAPVVEEVKPAPIIEETIQETVSESINDAGEIFADFDLDASEEESTSNYYSKKKKKNRN